MRQKAIHALDGGRIMAEYGPMRLVISACVGKVPQRDVCVSAAQEAFSCFERVAALKKELSSPFTRDLMCLEDSIARAMVESVREMGDEDLTPLAAVAGALADAVADFLFERGMTRVLVNNGGDISVRLLGDELVRVGLGPAAWQSPAWNVIVLDSSFSSWGVATSGLGGRSFTRGVASSVTVLATAACLADAAATAVANASFVEDASVIRRKAGEIDPGTDIPDLEVTLRVGPLSREKRYRAIGKALRRAEDLVEKGVILGASVSVDGESGFTSFFQDHLGNTEEVPRSII